MANNLWTKSRKIENPELKLYGLAYYGFGLFEYIWPGTLSNRTVYNVLIRLHLRLRPSAVTPTHSPQYLCNISLASSPGMTATSCCHMVSRSVFTELFAFIDTLDVHDIADFLTEAATWIPHSQGSSTVSSAIPTLCNRNSTLLIALETLLLKRRRRFIVIEGTPQKDCTKVYQNSSVIIVLLACELP